MTKRIWAILFILALIVGAVLWQVFHPGTPPVSVKRIGIVSLTAVDNRTFEGFREGMAGLGYVEQQSVHYLVGEPSGTKEVARQRIAELLAQGVDALLVSSTPVTQLARELTARHPVKVPVIFAPVNDPVAAGVVASLSQPSGNLTGIRLPVGDQLRLQWLQDLAPQVKKVLVPYTRSDQSAQTTLRELEAVAATLQLQLQAWPLEDEPDMAAVITALPEADAVFLPRDSRIEAKIAQWLDYARGRRLPLSAPSLLQVEQGALYSYGFIHREIGRQAARLMDQVLKGIPPGQLPVETAESYLGLNLRAAAEIGLPIPDKIIRQASLVIRPQQP
jgi:putative ABC transport system substrate-binding protein